MRLADPDQPRRAPAMGRAPVGRGMIAEALALGIERGAVEIGTRRHRPGEIAIIGLPVLRQRMGVRAVFRSLPFPFLSPFPSERQFRLNFTGRWRQLRLSFTDVHVLMPCKAWNAREPLAVEAYQSAGDELGAQSLDIAGIVGQITALHDARCPHETALAISLAPQADVQKPRERRQSADVVGGEELGLDGADAGHSVSFPCVVLGELEGMLEETAFASGDGLEFGAADQPVAEAEAAAVRRGLDVDAETAHAQEDRVVEMAAVERAFAVDDFAAEPSGAPDQEALDHDCGYCVYRKYMSRLLLRYTHCCGSR